MPDRHHPAPNSPTRPERIAQGERREEALRLRMAGLTFRAIASDLGVGLATAHDLVSGALDERAAAVRNQAEQLRALMAERVEEAVRAIWPRVEQGELGAIDRLVKLLDRAARLHGLDVQPAPEAAMPPTILVVSDIPPPMPIRALGDGTFERVIDAEPANWDTGEALEGPPRPADGLATPPA
jgi:hypothetical protein